MNAAQSDWRTTFFQVGLLTTMGLSAKNAILIIEFAELAVRRGEDVFAAALEASRGAYGLS